MSLPVVTQHWVDVTFVHWAAEPERVAPLLPAGTRPDTFDGVTYIGLIALRIYRTGLLNLPGLPYIGSFPEVNVRLYSVGPDGRRGVVFCSMEAARLVPVVSARSSLRLPYVWAGMRVDHDADVVTYTSGRRWPGPGGAGLRLQIYVEDHVPEPSPLENFLTARWGLHTGWYANRLCYLPNEHPPWSLCRARLLSLREDLVRTAGLPAPASAPISVLYSPGLQVRFGPPQWPR